MIYKEGTILCTLNSQMYTNAIVVNSNSNLTLILTDFGNLLNTPTSFVSDYYEIANGWKEMDALECPQQDVKERLQEQIDKLVDCLTKIG